MFSILFLYLLSDPFCILPGPGEAASDVAEVRSNPWAVLPALLPVMIEPKPEPKVLTKWIQVVKVPGRYVRECVNGVCRERWVPPVMESIEVLAKIAPEDERALVEYHWRLGPASCGMSWCITHRTQELVDDKGNPAPPGANPTGAGTDSPSAAAGLVSRGWRPGALLRKLRR